MFLISQGSSYLIVNDSKWNPFWVTRGGKGGGVDGVNWVRVGGGGSTVYLLLFSIYKVWRVPLMAFSPPCASDLDSDVSLKSVTLELEVSFWSVK